MKSDSDSVDLGWGLRMSPLVLVEGIDHHLSEAARNLMSVHFQKWKGHSKINFF